MGVVWHLCVPIIVSNIYASATLHLQSLTINYTKSLRLARARYPLYIDWFYLDQLLQRVYLTMKHRN